MRGWRAAPVVAIAVALAAAVALPLAIEGGDPPAATEADGWGDLPEALVPVLEAKARQYARRALRFTCEERIRRAEYDGKEATRERFRAHEYILVEDETVPGGLAALRTRPGSGGSNTESLELEWPEPFLWSQLFDPAIRSTLRFKVGELHTTPYRLALPISWVSSAPVFEGRRVTEWSGTVEIEYRTGNLLSVTAIPNLQEEKIRSELSRYLQAFRFLGFSTAPPPVGHELEARFAYEHDGLTYPSRVEIRTFRQVSRDERTTDRRRRVEFGEYRFFKTETEEEIPPLLLVPDANGSPGA